MSIKTLIIYTLLFVLPFALYAKKKDKGEKLSDSTQVVVNNIIIGGNKKTKEKIITRELMFKTGDTLFLEHVNKHIQKSKENLLNTSLFNFITINTIEESKNIINFYVIVEERWYLWPYLILEHADRNLSSFLYNNDWSKINYGLMLVKNNFRGLAETIKFKFRLGYKEQFQIAYEIPYIDKNRKHGIATDINWFRQTEIAYNTSNDQLVFHKDENNFISHIFNSHFSYQYRHKHYQFHKLTASYSYNWVKDTIISLNNNYFETASNKTEYLTLTYNFILDKRNYKHYPLKGYNFDLRASQKGLNILPNEMKGIWEIQAEYFYYKDFNNRFYTGFGAQGKISSNRKQPYFIEEGFGYNTYLRAFELNVIGGQSNTSTRAFFKYALVPTQIKHIEAWNWQKFNKIHYSLYLNLFTDSGYVYDTNPSPTNKYPNKYLASIGLGLDLVAYYDQIIRLEYSINRFGRSGIFMHLGKAF